MKIEKKRANIQRKEKRKKKRKEKKGEKKMGRGERKERIKGTTHAEDDILLFLYLVSL